jgi:hypothetical protein
MYCRVERDGSASDGEKSSGPGEDEKARAIQGIL